MNFDPTHFPTVFLSFDEPNADINYQHLLTLCPTALRVHGIKGSDTAHKAVANLVRSDRVTIVDGDNFVKSDFYRQTYELGPVEPTTTVISFTGNNIINGQQYGNGGIKSWPVELIKRMRTHEHTDNDSTLVDFDFSNYKQCNHIASDLHINGSPLQAWRAGFREGVKLMLDNGKFERDIHNIDWRNYDRLWNWMHIGSDIKNGLWAIHGARYGCWSAISGIDLHNLHDFDYITDLFNRIYQLIKNRLVQDCNRIGKFILDSTNDTRITDVFSVEDSKEYRQIVKPALRVPDETPYDIVYISYDEECADENYRTLKERFPRAKRISNIKGIHDAHIEAAKQCSTDYFWVVDADAQIVDTFNFDYVVPFYDELKVRVWRAKNPINDLVYGYGGVKLLPRISTIRMDRSKPDMTTSICKKYIPVPEISNTTAFNTGPFRTWRSAFRECCKLASGTIDHNNKESVDRLKIWTTTGLDRPYGKYCIDGANAGARYGEENKTREDKLQMINNFDWIKTQYDRFYANTV